jgi:lipid II:glycine glycyltransferase (peptidoglycan interpeptide bridge formation enzyme)
MHEGRIITSLWVFFWQDYVSPYYIGYDPAYLQYAPNNWVLWQVIKDSCAAGYRYYDMGRSRQGTGSYEFKRHWGIEPKPLYYQYYLHRAKNIPQVNPSNPKFDIPRRLWSHLPLGLTKIIGPHLVKYLG